MRSGFSCGLFLAGALAACSDHSASAPVAETVCEAGPAPDSGPDDAVLCSDGAVAAVLAAEEQADIDFAMAMRGRLQSPDAIAFAEKEITDHTLLLLSLQGAARDDGIALPANDDAAAVTQSMQVAIESLRSPSSTLAGPGLALDRAYIARAALGHAQDLAVLDALIAPSAHDVRIVATLREHRDLVAGHEALARQAQRALAGACGVAATAPPRR